MGKKRNAVGMARALWLQAQKVLPSPVVEHKPVLQQVQVPRIEGSLMHLLGQRYHDFAVMRVAVINGGVYAEWIVHHAPSDKRVRIVLTHQAAMVMPYQDLATWLAQRVKAAADGILDEMTKRTM